MFKDYGNAWNDKSTKENNTVIKEIFTEVEDSPSDDLKTGKVFNCEKVYLRKSDSQESDYVDILDKGTELLISETIGLWCKVATASGKEGYIMKKFVKIDN